MAYQNRKASRPLAIENEKLRAALVQYLSIENCPDKNVSADFLIETVKARREREIRLRKELNQKLDTITASNIELNREVFSLRNSVNRQSQTIKDIEDSRDHREDELRAQISTITAKRVKAVERLVAIRKRLDDEQKAHRQTARDMAAALRRVTKP